jgi:aldehyde:ferredoxin oxidoreductase
MRSPENVITLMAADHRTPISGQSRLNVNAKSPVGGAIGDSQSGGFFPAELKFAGFDGIVVKGRSAKPVYLTILNGEYALHDASHLSGKLTGEVDALLRAEVGQPKAEVLHTVRLPSGVVFSSLVSWRTATMGARKKRSDGK